jgi:hypothetical protein
VAEHAAVEIATELTLDEAGVTVAIRLSGPCKEGLQVLADESVENALLRLAAPVPRRE